MIRTWTAAGRASFGPPEACADLEAAVASAGLRWFPLVSLPITPHAEPLARVIHGLKLPRVTDAAYGPAALDGAPIFAVRSWWPNGRADLFGLDVRGDLVPLWIDFHERGDALPDLDSEDLRALPVLETRRRGGLLEDLHLVTPAGAYWLRRGGSEDGVAFRVLIERAGEPVHSYEPLPLPVESE